MSNYPNMSYCMFENTAGALTQVVDAMQEAVRTRDLNMSSTERRAYEELYDLCRHFMKQAEFLDGADMDAEIDISPFD